MELPRQRRGSRSDHFDMTRTGGLHRGVFRFHKHTSNLDQTDRNPQNNPPVLFGSLGVRLLEGWSHKPS